MTCMDFNLDSITNCKPVKQNIDRLTEIFSRCEWHTAMSTPLLMVG